MKRIVKLVEKIHEKIGDNVSISLDIWKFKSSGRTTDEWSLWDGQTSTTFSTFQDLTDYLVWIRRV